MGQFLRDQRLRNLNIDEAALDKLNTVFVGRVAAKNVPLLPPQPPRNAPQGAQAAAGAQTAQPPQAQGVPAAQPQAAGQVAGVGAQAGQAQFAQVLSKIAFPYYVLRFDDKGYRFTNFAEVKQNYSEAREVERVIFVVDSGENRQSGGMSGTQLELRLDAKDPNMCYLTVTADDKRWVEDTFAALMQVLSDQQNRSGWVRTQWTGAAIQLIGVCVGFLFSLWAAVIISPNLSIDNAFAVSLIFALLIFGNVWGYLNAQIARLVDLAFPNVRFKRKEKEGFRWLLRGVFIGLAVAFSLYVMNQLLTFVGSVLGSFLK